MSKHRKEARLERVDLEVLAERAPREHKHHLRARRRAREHAGTSARRSLVTDSSPGCSLFTGRGPVLTSTGSSSLLTLLTPLFTVHCSLFTVHCSLLTAHCSLLTARGCDAALTAHDAMLPAVPAHPLWSARSLLPPSCPTPPQTPQ
eukprot:2453394-Rhodomonas_salina.1